MTYVSYAKYECHTTVLVWPS